MTFAVESAGLGSTLQDRGRPGSGHLGVGPSGAFDRDALRQVNALLGNAPGDAAVETYGGLTLLAGAPHVIAVTGAVGPVLLDGRPVPHGRAVPVAAGQRLAVGLPTTGMRVYLGVSGGFAARAELGSMSSDTLSGLGPPRLVAGQTVTTGARRTIPALDDVPPLIRSGGVDVDVVLGPRDDWFTVEAVRRLLETAWTLSAASDRIGLRLDGRRLDRSVLAELPSEPVVRGSIQVTTAGQPVVFGPDHPVTGGYPVIAVVVDSHTDRLAQVRPGDSVRLHRRA
ncbi:biotin-dependent carboxyltransferase family protein [Aeromicrobium endophyticum]|uniref:Allophanate hydrolase subunit 2 family protein n=1 Tax=Aeromicrobium endophyticum TaxID=2292704 RepID=A0A371P9X6_9ACTN|nr:biotin-dependent carboxyltransferase family protein [Aeromicrobium endophyticum]REK72338.1 allophanate hydrolase subunit 2 family protein [Aeromicrobium endophyticum]